MIELSVIVPVYKSEQFLHRCIDSILAQSFTDFELLLVDDGSPDNCGAICDDYAARDNRVHVFHKVNGGVCSARNLGIEQAQGVWITFVDSDDWIDYNHFECLIAGGYDDFIFGGIKLCSSSSSIRFVEKKYTCKSLIDFINHNKGYRLNSPCGHLYKRTILKNNNIRFDVGIRFGEDAIFNLRYLCFCNSVRTISSCGYNYWDYDISSDASSKYKLSINEINYTLTLMVSLNKRLSGILGGEISSIADYAMMLGMVPVEQRCEKKIGEEFFIMCKNLAIVEDKKQFLNNELCSPIFQGIARLKSLYKIESYIKAKDLFYIISEYLNRPSIKNDLTKNLRFRCKDFYLWCNLIKWNLWPIFDILMKFYVRIVR